MGNPQPSPATRHGVGCSSTTKRQWVSEKKEDSFVARLRYSLIPCESMPPGVSARVFVQSQVGVMVSFVCLTKEEWCNNSPAESTSPENGWRSSVVPILCRWRKCDAPASRWAWGFVTKGRA